ncbi:NMDA receptor-regulated protein 1-domain-containing protein [Irpex rosettiformis]|uniref:NMDA receptor-regulated protein 1-domain-containing protein n=1 Tax=Irpex rosettiformis TaxID=378272 RepID=A0ACB8TRR9_9APHY|nr:NMDA receptor-regulated protein 1-domain-containing protein [Irpex rosettiformis]
MPPSGIPAKRALPLKEAALFKELLNQYESRQLKKAQKTADQILKKFPEHGETLCMKGLVLTHMGRREEGLDLVKKGVRLDLTSHIVWHVFGLLQKGEKNYEEALKSYTQALRFDKENMNILRDAAHLQTQLRHYDGLVETRHALLRIRPNLRSNWIGLAVAYHLNGNLVEAKKTLEHYELILKNIPDYDVEHSEVLLYHIHVLEVLGEYTEALNLLDVSAKSRAIIDRVSIMEYRARLLSKLGQHDDAEHTWQALIEQNPDSYKYYQGYLSNRGLDLSSISDETRAKTLNILKDFSTQLPRAAAPRRLALDVATGDEFKTLAEHYLVVGIEKGIPSLFADVKSLYKDSQKLEAIASIVEGHRTASVASTSSPLSEPPTTYLWTLYFLAQHYSHTGQHEKALELLSDALEHTPTLPDLLMLKARVLKRLGDPYGAAKAMDEARVLDLQDRFLNTKCGKYRLRAGMNEEAQEVFGLFTKKDAPSPGADLEDMQSLLFLVGDADSHRRNGDLGHALKKYHAVQKVFNEIEDDQYDFHGYSLRKFAVNIYMNMITWEDRLRSHPAYVHAAIAASEIYVQLHDDPSLAKKNSPSSTLTEAEKKAKKKAKKAAQKVQEDAKKAAQSANATEDKGLEPSPTKDEDPDGAKLLQVTDPLERAAKFLAPLAVQAQDNILAWIAIYDVAVRRSKYLQAAQALSRAKSIDAGYPELHVRLVHFRKTVSSLPQPPPAPIGPALTESLQSLLPDEVALETFNSQYLQKHPGDSRAALAFAKALRVLQTPLEEIENVLFDQLRPENTLDIKTAQNIFAFFREINSTKVEELRSQLDAKFPLSTVFKSAQEVAALRKQAFADVEVVEAEKVESVS